METVKVDIQKLQLLNDRIAQTIDALNQVRMSVHGIQHSPAQVSPWGYGAGFGAPYGAYPTPSYGFAPQFPPFGGLPFAQQSPYGSPFVGGLQHTSTPFAQNPYASPYTTSPYATSPYVTPFGISHTNSPVASTLGTWTMPYVGNGISHTSWDPTTWQTWQTRTAQTFPFVQSAYPTPVV